MFRKPFHSFLSFWPFYIFIDILNKLYRAALVARCYFNKQMPTYKFYRKNK